jgi:hypothetical protein
MCRETEVARRPTSQGLAILRFAKTLSEEETACLYEKAQSILQKAIDCQGSTVYSYQAPKEGLLPKFQSGLRPGWQTLPFLRQKSRKNKGSRPHHGLLSSLSI